MPGAIVHSLRRVFTIKINGGVLQLTIGIGLIISAICASMIILVYYARLSFLQLTVSDKLRRNTESGIQYLMANRNTIKFAEPLKIDLFADGTDSVTMVSKPWGVFELLKSSMKQGNLSFARAGLLTAEPDSIGISCLHLPIGNAPVSLAGTAVLKGDAYVRRGGISVGFINGKAFKGEKLLDGKYRTSKYIMPPLDSTLFHEVRLIMEGRQSAYSLVELPNLPRGHKSFLNDSIFYYHSSDTLQLTDTLSGSAIIHSEKKISITREAKLNDIILIAPQITIAAGFKGRLQCFSTQYISVGEMAQLRYPSSLTLMGQERDSLIDLHRGAIVEGVAIVLGHDVTIGSTGVLKIAKNAILHGQAYCNGAANIEGEIRGHITLRNFQTSVGPNVSENYLMDGRIDVTRRSPDFPSVLFWASTKTYVIAKWLE